MKLSVVVGTYNRLSHLKDCIDSIFRETASEVKVYVTDAGSSDGTIEYLNSVVSERIIPVLEGERLGQARAYNRVFEMVDTQYVCWLSDDNVIVNRGLDTALEILESDPDIGMVGLKVKDMQGPFVSAPYIGGISSIGVLNVNQGMLPTEVLKKAGGFCEEFMDYGIDPDITMKVLTLGYKIVYTKRISIHHYRNWVTDKDEPGYQALKNKHKRYYELYDLKYSKYDSSDLVTSLVNTINRVVFARWIRKSAGRIRLVRDLYNVLNARYIKIFDLIVNINKEYYLVQFPPELKNSRQI